MPLNALWGYYLFDHVSEAPKIFYGFWFCGSLGLTLTTAFSLYHVVHDHMTLEQTLHREGHAVTPMNVQLAGAISTLPIFTAGVAYTCLWVPALGFVLELLIAIFSCIAIGSLVQYFLQALGEPPAPRRLMRKVPKKRWWCGSLCGGVNDLLPGLGLMWSKEPHRLQLTDLRFAFRVVAFFIWSFVFLSAWQASVSMVPTQVERDDRGWCNYPKPIGHTLQVLLIVFAVLSTFVGTAGLSIIANGVAFALGEADEELSKEKYGVLKKASVGQIYLQLPLIKVFMSFFPVAYPSPTILVPKTTMAFATGKGMWQSSGEYVPCPVYDADVMVHMFYCTTVILLMAYTSYHNMKLYIPSRDRDVARQLREELEARLIASGDDDDMQGTDGSINDR
ncbi:unnamed protein product [Effrenium voratum]|uniref:Uncharacterized protein n=1 Tax=Effrenium voratum TaxID=2562239 RepID=A0AA36I887_9DINO|nr:unnamed protein product [Effrenium voratum]CAJ1414760.1 unnamed protein product [Effrenium voratum]